MLNSIPLTLKSFTLYSSTALFIVGCYSSIKYYKAQCEDLQSELSKLKFQFGIQENKPSESNNTNSAPKIHPTNSAQKPKIPFEKIADESYLITDKARQASMCVTSCNGELNPPFISAKGINFLKSNFVSNGLDIFVDTYAKCGTTVGIKMVYKILEANNKISAGSNKSKLNDPWNAVPWIEVDVSQQLLTSNVPNKFLSFIDESNKNGTHRIWKTHQPFNNFPVKEIGDNTKVIHIIRNPKDVICSYYDFFRKEPLVNYKGSFNTLFNWFCDGTVVHSSIFDFELNWFRTQKDCILNDKQLLIISYEDIVRKPEEIINRVAMFLGYKLKKNEISKIAYEISFKKSKMEAQKNSDIPVIVNKGKIGRWKDILTNEQSERMDRIINTRLKDSGIKFIFE